MDTDMNDVDSLFSMAAGAEKAPPLDTAGVLRRIRIAQTSRAAPGFEPPMRLFIGIGSVAAALAVIVAGFAATAWSALHDPIRIMQTLPDILSFLKI